MNRMFQVIVVGGVALTAQACSGTVRQASSEGTSSASVGAGGFPSEGPSSSVGVGGFPSELGTMVTTTSTGVGGMGTGGFPQEGPQMIDAGGLGDGAAADGSPPCFPGETAFTCPDAG